MSTSHMGLMRKGQDFLLFMFWFFVLPFGCGGFNTPCISLKRAPEYTSFKGGHTRECFAHAIISFESCRQLLFHSTTCSSLSYMDKECSLHDHTRLDFERSDTYLKVPKATSTIPIVYIKEDIHLTEACSQHGFKSALDKFKECRGRVSPSSGSTLATGSPLPLLGIVISVTAHWAHTHKAAIASITSNFECYTAAHSYVFVLNVMEDMPVEQFFHDRHHSVLHQHLHRFQFLLHLDADSLVLNISRSLDSFLQPSSPHVQLHMNENGEVTAATYLLRNSAYARCFLHYWGDFSPPRLSNNYLNEQPQLSSTSSTTPNSYHAPYDERLYDVPNYDNGDLVSAVMNWLGPDVYLVCIQVVASLPSRVTRRFTNSYHQTVVECWKVLHSTLQSREAEWGGNHLKIYLPKEGYWRTHSRRNRFGTSPAHWWNLLKASCFPSSDIIGHGWKGMMRKMWPMVSDAQGEYNIHHANSTRICAVAMATTSSGGNPRCRWLDPAAELLVARRSCNWRSPICWQEEEGEEKGKGKGEGVCAGAALAVGGNDDLFGNMGTEKPPSEQDLFRAARSKPRCNL